MNDDPGVSYVMPVLNEAGYVETAVPASSSRTTPVRSRSCWPSGRRTDGTARSSSAWRRPMPASAIVENPGMDIPIGLNLAIAAAQAPDHRPGGRPHRARPRLHRARRRRPRAHRRRERRRHHGRHRRARVPGRGRPRVQQPLRARRRRVPRRARRSAGPAESAYLGVMRARRARRGRRLRRDPAPRRGLGAQLPPPAGRAGRLARPGAAGQVLAAQQPGASWPGSSSRPASGAPNWCAASAARNPLRFFAPPVLVIATVLSIVAIPLHATGVLHGIRAGSSPLVYLGPLVYVVLLRRRGGHGAGSLADRLRFMRRDRDHALQLGSRILARLHRAGPATRSTPRAPRAERLELSPASPRSSEPRAPPALPAEPSSRGRETGAPGGALVGEGGSRGIRPQDRARAARRESCTTGPGASASRSK